MLNMGVSLPEAYLSVVSSLPRNDYAVWVGGTTYNAGNRIITTDLRLVYECILSHATSQSPTAVGSIYWVKVGMVDELSVFDGSVATGPVRAAPNYYWQTRTTYIPAIALFGFNGKTLSVWKLVETGVAAINKVFSSEDFSANFAETAVSISRTAANDSDVEPLLGVYNATPMKENGATSVHQIVSAETRTYTATTSYTVSVYAKRAVGTRNVRIDFPTAQFGTMNATFTLSGAGSTTVSAGGTATITSLTNSWYRCSLTATCSTTGVGNMGAISMLSGTTQSYPGDTTSKLWLYGHQNNDGGVVAYEVKIATTPLTRTLEMTHTFVDPPSAAIDFGQFYSVSTRQSFIVKPTVAPYFYEVQIAKKLNLAKPYAGEIALIVDPLILGTITYPIDDNLLDFSVKQRDDFGNITLLKRNAADDMNYTFTIDNVNRVATRNVLKSRRAMPLVFWDDEDMSDVKGLLQYAFINGYSMPYSPSCAWQTVTLDTEGLT